MKRGMGVLFILFIIIFIVALVSVGFFSYKIVTSNDEDKDDRGVNREDNKTNGYVDDDRRVNLGDIIPDINYSELELFTCNEIQVSEEGFINLVIISDKYENQGQFDLDIGGILISGDGSYNGLFSTEPFKTYKDSFNVYTIFSKNDLKCENKTGLISNQLCAKNSLKKISGDICGLSRIDKIITLSTYKEYNRAGGFGGCEAHSSDVFTTLHEFGHSLGGLGEEYLGVRGVRYNKPITITSRVNGDAIGCPKWCSGDLNTSAECYPYYEELMNCFEEGYALGYDPHINSTYFDTCERNVYAQGDERNFLQKCDLGVACLEETGCYIGGNSWYQGRPSVCSIMGGIADETTDNCNSFGKISEDHIISVIEKYERGEGESC